MLTTHRFDVCNGDADGLCAALQWRLHERLPATLQPGLKRDIALLERVRTKQKLSMIATATNQGKARWMITADAFDADKLLEFLHALVKDAGSPEEALNADLEQEMCKRVPVRTKAKLREAANEHMTMLDQTPERVIGYFQDRRVRYAA